MWHIQDSQGQILAVAFRLKVVDHFKVFPLRSEADDGRVRGSLNSRLESNKEEKEERIAIF